MGDDAAGPHVVARLSARYDFSPKVSVVDLGTPGLDLTPYLADLRAAIIVDTVKGDRPGDVRVFRLAELLTQRPSPRLSPHDPGLTECLLTLDLAGRAPAEVMVAGVVPETVDGQTRLSAAVRRALPKLVDTVLGELHRLGVRAEERRDASEPDIWWESQQVDGGSAGAE